MSSTTTLTTNDLLGFDREARMLIIEAMAAGCTGRVSHRGHAILHNAAGQTEAISRNLSSQNRAAQNARAAVKRLLDAHRAALGAPKQPALTLVPRRTQHLTVSQAFAEHGAAFSRWFADRIGQETFQRVEVRFDTDGTPRFQAIQLAEHPAPDQNEEATPVSTPEPLPADTLEAEQSQQAEEPVEADPASPAPAADDHDAARTLEQLRAVLGEDPRIAVLETRVQELEAALETERDRTAQALALFAEIEQHLDSASAVLSRATEALCA